MGKRYRKMAKKANGKIREIMDGTGQEMEWRGYGSALGSGALLRAEKKFMRVKGYREIPKLIAALQHPNPDLEILKSTEPLVPSFLRRQESSISSLSGFPPEFTPASIKQGRE